MIDCASNTSSRGRTLPNHLLNYCRHPCGGSPTITVADDTGPGNARILKELTALRRGCLPRYLMQAGTPGVGAGADALLAFYGWQGAMRRGWDGVRYETQQHGSLDLPLTLCTDHRARQSVAPNGALERLPNLIPAAPRAYALPASHICALRSVHLTLYSSPRCVVSTLRNRSHNCAVLSYQSPHSQPATFPLSR